LNSGNAGSNIAAWVGAAIDQAAARSAPNETGTHCYHFATQLGSSARYGTPLTRHHNFPNPIKFG
jgi:hypothetical protein